MGFSFEAHNNLGLELMDLHDRMLQIMGEIYKNYPTDSKAWMRANLAAGKILELRYELDACASQEYRENEDLALSKLYFSRSREKPAPAVCALPLESHQD